MEYQGYRPFRRRGGGKANRKRVSGKVLLAEMREENERDKI